MSVHIDVKKGGVGEQWMACRDLQANNKISRLIFTSKAG